MRLMPKRVKYRKSQRQKIKGNATRCNTVAFGEFGLQSLEPGWISAQQLEAGRVAASHSLPREGKLTIRVFPHKSVTSKPIETRMGKGKGEPELWVAVVKPGTILYELSGINEEIARQTFNRMAHKMPVKVRLVQRRKIV
ncbi:MAG: 50S ribosomal protein L16 [Candidatus Jettenia sp.]|nr:50S ribosomal protein L16 [Candidatus Jettenia sp. AMX1]MBC6927691.1 50S ribosomal protein L16 [Candidatus Jettenia sp.]NUN22107.1 50S ribosomal protein L16 [Candidatus Jettenia caeni]KAA0251381.1 MAG: 50S ribosomal protein L16 [Candidatus Jettenia sp. AMX1]MCE7879357.1 50S ribosomal protein L16 [Candidatus Jettenia sp. AMX1]MDL1938306.1 50S ribosomal protein L16 [Candidatus Jettenia sp. AMX1]